MFSWGWASQQPSPILKLHINSMIEEGKDWLYILTERGAEIWNSSEKEDVVCIYFYKYYSYQYLIFCY